MRMTSVSIRLSCFLASAVVCWLCGILPAAAAQSFCEALAAQSPEVKGVEVQYPPPDDLLERLAAGNADLHFGSDEALGGFYRADMDGDGRLDNVVFTNEGSARSWRVYVVDPDWQWLASKADPGEPPEPCIWRRDHPCEGASDAVCLRNRISLLSYRKQHYLVESCDGEVTHAWWYHSVEAGGSCRFIYGNRVRETIALSHDDTLCNLGLRGALSYVPFDRTHRIPKGSSFYGGFHGEFLWPDDQAAAVDIDNDGTRDLVVQLSYAYAGGAGCGFTTLGVLNSARDGILLTPVATLLMQRSAECRDSVAWPIVFRDQAYIEVRNGEREVSDPMLDKPRSHHSIIQIRGGEAHVVCEYDVRREVTGIR